MLKNVWYLRIASLLLAAALLGLTSGDTNYTVDDFERSRIDYLPAVSWMAISIPATQDRFKQTTTYTHDQGAFATFRFMGSAIYYGGYGELVTPPDTPGEIRVSLDNDIYDVSANTNPSQPAQQILFSKAGLDPTKQHVITVQKTSESGKRDLNIDFFIYTVPDGLNDTKIPANSTNHDTTQTQVGSPIGALVAGILGGALGGMLLVGLTLWFINRKAKKRKSKDEFIIDPRPLLTSDVPHHPEYIPSPYPLTNAQYYPPELSTSRTTFESVRDYSPGPFTSHLTVPVAEGRRRSSAGGISREPSSNGHEVLSDDPVISSNQVPPPGYTDQQIPTPPSSSSISTGLLTSPTPSLGRDTRSSKSPAAPVNPPAAIPLRKIRLDRSTGQETRRKDRL